MGVTLVGEVEYLRRIRQTRDMQREFCETNLPGIGQLLIEEELFLCVQS